MALSIVSVFGERKATGTGSFSLTLPSFAAGDLVYVFVARYFTTVDEDSGDWEDWATWGGGSGIGTVNAIRRVMAGGDGGTINVTPSGGSYDCTYIGVTLRGQHASDIGIIAGGYAAATSTSPNAGAGSWPWSAAEETLQLTLMSCDGRVGYSSKPTSYALVDPTYGFVNGSGYNNSTLAVAAKLITGASSDDPEAWGISGNRAWAVQNIAIRPAAGGSVAALASTVRL